MITIEAVNGTTVDAKTPMSVLSAVTEALKNIIDKANSTMTFHKTRFVAMDMNADESRISMGLSIVDDTEKELGLVITNISINEDCVATFYCDDATTGPLDKTERIRFTQIAHGLKLTVTEELMGVLGGINE